MYSFLLFQVNHLIFLAGSKLETAISEGPEALQKYIDSGEIEELHDVMPIGDDEDYLNDDYDTPEPSGGTTNNIPSLMQIDTSGALSQETNRSLDSDMRSGDQDMRSFPSFGRDSDLRNLEPEFRHTVNRELNFQPPPLREYAEMGDEDFRQSYRSDQDFRHYEDEEGYDEYYDESRNWQRSNGNYSQFGARNQNFQNNFRNQGNNFNQFGTQNEGWSGHEFRGRGAKRGGTRGQRNPRSSRGATRARGSQRGSGRGGGAPSRGQSSSRGRF